jgi:hypothetical protein
LVPVTKTAAPEAPDGGHSSQVGTLLDAAPVALPDDPPKLPEDEDVARVAREALDGTLAVPTPDAEFVVAVRAVDPVAVPPVVVDVVG